MNRTPARELWDSMRHNKTPEELSAIARKAAATRLAKDPDAFSKMGKKGSLRRHARSPEERSLISKKVAAKRLKKDPDVFAKMGKIGGAISRRRSLH